MPVAWWQFRTHHKTASIGRRIFVKSHYVNALHGRLPAEQRLGSLDLNFQLIISMVHLEGDEELELAARISNAMGSPRGTAEYRAYNALESKLRTMLERRLGLATAGLHDDQVAFAAQNLQQVFGTDILGLLQEQRRLLPRRSSVEDTSDDGAGASAGDHVPRCRTERPLSTSGGTLMRRTDDHAAASPAPPVVLGASSPRTPLSRLRTTSIGGDGGGEGARVSAPCATEAHMGGGGADHHEPEQHQEGRRVRARTMPATDASMAPADDGGCVNERARTHLKNAAIALRTLAQSLAQTAETVSYLLEDCLYSDHPQNRNRLS